VTAGERNSPIRLLALICVTLVVLGQGPAHAQAPGALPPELGYVFPPVVQRGATTDVQLGGYDWTDDLEWFVHDPRITLQPHGPISDYLITPPPYWVGKRAGIAPPPIPREIAATINCPAEVPVGPVYWQVANANGSSATALFYVSDGVEIVENRSRDLPQQISALPVAVSGRISRLTEVDRYEITPAKSGLVSVDLFARRLGSNFQPVLEVRDQAGKLLTSFSGAFGQDGAVTFAVTSGQTYSISVYDADFRGDRANIYRLAITEGPRVIATIPAQGASGATMDVEFVGIGLATGAAVEESIRQQVTFPAAGQAAVHRQVVETAFGNTSVEIPVSALPEVTSPSLTFIDGTPLLSGQIGVTAAFPAQHAESRYLLDAVEKESWSIRAASQEFGSSLDVNLRILDAQGKVLAEADDQPGTVDAQAEFVAPATGRYSIVIRSTSPPLGSLCEIYRLEIDRLEPDFRLIAPQQINVPLGGKADIKFTLQREGGFTGPVAVSVEGLPSGTMAAGDWTIPEGKNELLATLQSEATAEVVARVIRFQGRATVAGTEVSHPARTQFSGNLAPRSPSELQRSESLLAVTMPAPFEIKVVTRQTSNELPRGTTFLCPLEIVRQPGFTGELQIAMNAKQDRHRKGMRGPLMPVPTDATRVHYPIFMPEWLAIELTCRMVVHGIGAVPDPRGRIRYLTRAGDNRITMIMEAALLKLDCPTPQLQAHLGDEISIPIVVSRGVQLPLPTTVELEIPEELKGIVECDPITLSAEVSEGVLKVRTQSDPRLLGCWFWTLKATSLQDDRWPVVSQADVDIRIESTTKVSAP
jgi:hypothetical protein